MSDTSLTMKNVTVILFYFFHTVLFHDMDVDQLDYVNILSKLKKKNDYVNISYGARRTTKDVMNYYTVYGGRLMTLLSRIYSRGMHFKKIYSCRTFFF